MNCTVCGNPLPAGRVVFRCYCGAFVHGHCWEKHVVQSHKPPFTQGYITLDGEFSPEEVAAVAGNGSKDEGDNRADDPLA